MPLHLNVLKKYKTNDIFIETGTYTGDGLQIAIEAGYKQIHSIELKHEFVVEAQKRFKKEIAKGIVFLHEGDSSIVLGEILENIHEPCTFWLDAHYSCGNTAIGQTWSPIVKELETINRHPIRNHIILVDDMRCMDNTHVDETTKKWTGFIGKQKTADMVQNINLQYKISFEDGCVPNDVLVAHF